MSLSVFSVGNKWHKNGIWWFSKMLNRVVGEERYESVRIYRRIWAAKVYYLRRQWMYRLFINAPDAAALFGIYPMIDSSHGYGSYTAYEMYRDFQENTLNSDGSFGMWVVFFCAVYLIHECYTYFIPFYWNKTAGVKNGEAQRFRMRDALNSMTLEDSLGYAFLEWGYGPHVCFTIQEQLASGHAHPDDARAMVTSSLVRKNRYVEHYGHLKDNRKKMIGF